ncbi:hypothetical protein [Azospirillum sp.]|uniref:hypothetical protein n=1 Tax=Azospirillum sp. TaxID=34012 RepID=UPI0026219F29|nr:hypothetical protein [Azospirillum sp.]
MAMFLIPNQEAFLMLRRNISEADYAECRKVSQRAFAPQHNRHTPPPVTLHPVN